MTAEQAIEVLSHRRGKMYDPLVVDAFVRAHDTLCVSADAEHVPAALLAAPQETAIANTTSVTGTTPGCAT